MRLALVLPGVAIGFAATVILGPGNQRVVEGARVHAAPAVGDVVPSVRLVVVRRLDGSEEPAADLSVAIEAGAARATAVTGADGVVDVTLDPPAARGARLVARAGALVLADGPLAVPAGEPPSTQLGAATGRTEGALRVHLAPQRGQLTPPFPEVVTVRVSRDEGGHEVDVAARVELEIVGGAPARTTVDVDPARGPSQVTVTPEALRVDVEAKARDAGGREGRFAGSLDTVPGALWIAPGGGPSIAVASPAPRRAAYLSLHGARGRIAGFAVPLADDGRGFHRGEVAWPASTPPGAVLVAAGDPEERGPSTVAWPVAEGGGAALAPRLIRVLDGVAPAEARERARAVSARRLAVAVAAVCGLAAVVALVLEGRRAQRALDEHLRTASEGATDEARRGIAAVGRHAARAGSRTATVLGALIALAFGVVAALVLVR